MARSRPPPGRLRQSPAPNPPPPPVIPQRPEQAAARRPRMAIPAFPALTDWFLTHNYAVLLPQRPGHGETGGRYLEDQGSCARPDYVKSGMATADSIAAAIGFIT